MRKFDIGIEAGAAQALGSLNQILYLPDSFAEMLPVGVYACDGEGVIVGFNRRATEIWGRVPAVGDSDQRYCGAFRLYLTDGQPLPHNLTPMAEVLTGGKPARDVEVVVERPDGDRVNLVVNIEPLHDEEGQVVGAIGCMLDITDRKRSERRAIEREKWYQDILDAIPAAIYTTDAQGRITYYNKTAVEFSGRRPSLGNDEWCVTWKLYHTDGTPMPHEQCPMAIALKKDMPVRGDEAIAERPDGTRIPFVPYPTPLHDMSGKLIGAVNMLVDVSDRKRAEHSQHLLAAIVESSDDAIVSKNLDGVITTWNRGAERLFGFTAEEAVGRPITMLIPPDRQDEEKSIIERIRRGERMEHYETVRRRKDGGAVEISLTVSPVKGSDGRIVGASKIARDIGDRKRAERRLELLARELDHRAKNILAVIQAMITITRAPTVREFAAALLGRVKSLARAHSLLSETRWDGADLGRLVTEELAPYGDKERAKAVGPKLLLAPAAAQTMAMAVHELATNALKYGAFSVPGGQVSVTWSRGADGRLALRWSEAGGPETREPRYRGIGLGVIERSIRDQLGGGVAFAWRKEGLVCEIDLPADSLAPP